MAGTKIYLYPAFPFDIIALPDNDTKGVQMNDIINLLRLEDDSIIVTEVNISGTIRSITLEKKLVPMYCPSCLCRMHSRGKKIRTVNHPIFQDGLKTVLKIHQRRWKCDICGLSFADSFPFIKKYKHSTNITDYLIIDAMKDITHSVCDVAMKFNVSDTYVHQTFDRYVDMKRLPLTEAICIDEVHTETVSYSKYSMIILDFITGQPIDMLPSRQKRDTSDYFAAIPIAERRQVKYLITDMYNPYLAFAEAYFPNAICAIDSYHVIQWLLHRINLLLIKLTKIFKERDEKYIEERLLENKPIREGWKSDEVYLLQNHRWIMLKNVDNIDYTLPSRRDHHFGYYMDAYRYEELFFKIHPDLRTIRDLKEKYIQFNKRNLGNPNQAALELDDLIMFYRNTGFPIFNGFADLLEKYKSEIINSFIAIMKYDSDRPQAFSRLSSGVIESFNRKPKDMKRNARGYRNFNHMRNRLLFATRDDPPILGTPKSADEVKNYTGKKRGPYKK